ncbi:MAG: D-alanyl-D-alanine carboxypeptidase [Ruminococcaceae bacterium]|nr:D-alanyl-D-alanine carboxypeptidase [Oscillospiraceae bacterium]
MKRKISIFLCALMLFAFVFGISAHAAMYDQNKINSTYAAVYNAEKGTFLFEKNADVRISASNCAKIMTAVLALEHYADLDMVITVPLASIQGLDGATIFGLLSGEKVTVRDLIYTMLVGNCNDSASVLACDMEKTNALFALKMNEKVAEIGLTDTFFKNSTGLGAKDSYTTVKDCLLLASYALGIDGFSEIVNTAKYTVYETNKHGNKTVYTKNYFLSKQTFADYYWQDASGFSATYTDEEGYGLISTYTAYSMTYICMCTGAHKSDSGKILAYGDVKNLLRWASEEYTTLKVLDSSKIFDELPIKLSGERNYVPVVPEASLYAYLPHDTDIGTAIEQRYELSVKELEAPVEIGDVVGKVTLYYEGKEIASCNLVTKFSADRSTALAFRASLFSPQMIIAVAISALLCVGIGTLRFFALSKILKRGNSE